MRLVQFGSFVFPLYNKRDVLSPGASGGALISLPSNTAWDNYQDDQSTESPARYRTAFEIVETTAAAVQTKRDQIRARRGLVRRLWAQMPDETMRFVWARLSAIRMEHDYRYTFYQPVELEFEVAQPGWNGSGHGVGWTLDSGEYLDDGEWLDEADVTTLTSSGMTVTINNGGNRPQTAITITITGGTSSISNIRLVCSPCDIKFSGTVAAGQSCIINTATKSVLNNAVNAYASFSLEAGHTVADWFRLAAGDNTVTITYSGNATNNATITWEYCDGWE